MEHVQVSNDYLGRQPIESEVKQSRGNYNSVVKKTDKGTQHTVGVTEGLPCISVNIQCRHLAVDERTIAEADTKVVEDHKILIQISDAIISWDEVTTLGVWLHCNPNDIARLRGDGFTIKEAAYEILRSFYQRTSSKDDKVQMLKEVVKELGKEAMITDFNLSA